MNQEELLANSITQEENALSRLQYWLKYEKYTWILGSVIIWLPPQIILTGLMVLATVFTPYMLWQLFRAGWYRPIVVFFGVVILPYLVFQFVPTEHTIGSFLFIIFPLLAFYLYTWVLSNLIKQSLLDLREIRKLRSSSLNKSFDGS